jgi:signal peptide peptidase SppA
MITSEGLDVVLQIIDRRLENVKLSEDELAVLRDRSKAEELTLPSTPSIAVLPIHGSIFPKANLMSAFSGGTSLSKLKSDFNQLMESEMVTGILLDIDSPGGHADMVKEMADVIFEARQSGKKPIHAIANSLCASAGYYLGSQAERLYATPSAIVGSIGVIAVHTDESKKEADEGVKRTVLTMGDFKADGHPSMPLSDGAKQRKLENMKETYDQFVSDVARGRGVTTEDVEASYGNGGVLYSKKALERGLVDGINTIEQVSQLMLGSNRSKNALRNGNSNRGVTMPELTPETLEILGLSEDATDDELNAAIGSLATTPAPAPVAPTIPEITPEFEKAYPEIAEQLKADRETVATLRAQGRIDAAKLFASGYEEFVSEKGKTGFGFSGLALTQVEEMHLKIADGLMSHDDLKAFLDNVASGSGVVDYKEHGSSRGSEPDEINVESAHEAGMEVRRLAEALQIESGNSYGDCLAAVMKNPEHKGLVDLYNSGRQARPTHNSGGDN